MLGSQGIVLQPRFRSRLLKRGFGLLFDSVLAKLVQSWGCLLFTDAHKALSERSAMRPRSALSRYSFRHTFLTRLGESGCDAWTLARIAGQSNIAISQRYVHPSGDAVLLAMSRLGGHNTGHTEKQRFQQQRRMKQ